MRLVEEPPEPREQFVVVPEAACDQDFDAKFSAHARFIQTLLQQSEVMHPVVLTFCAALRLAESQAAGARREQQRQRPVGLSRAELLEARNIRRFQAAANPSHELVAGNAVACCAHAEPTYRWGRGEGHPFTSSFTRLLFGTAAQRSRGTQARAWHELPIRCLAMMIMTVKVMMMVMH